MRSARLQQSALRSPVDRAQLEFVSATLRQDEPAQERALTALARLMPHDLALLRQLAAREMNARNFPEAVRYYQAIAAGKPRRYRDPGTCWGMPRLSRAMLESARKSFERYGRDPAHAANALDSQGEALFLNGKFAEAEKYFLDAHAKSSALLGGGDLLKAAYSHWLQGDLPGADQTVFAVFGIPQPAERSLWFRGVRRFGSIPQAARKRPWPACRTFRPDRPRTSSQAQLALWKDPSKLPQDPAALKQAYRTNSTGRGRHYAGSLRRGFGARRSKGRGQEADRAMAACRDRKAILCCNRSCFRNTWS